MRRYSLWAALLVTLLSVYACSSAWLEILHSLLQEEIAATQQDFIEYWAARVAQRNHEEIYNPLVIGRIESAIRPISEPLMMWNPPWVPLILSFVLDSPYHEAFSSWYRINVGALILSGIALISLGFHRTLVQQASALLMVSTFSPVLQALHMGQLGILLLLVCSGIFLAFRYHHFLLVGALAAFLTAKPHLFLGFFLFGWFCIPHNKKCDVVIGSFGGLAALWVPTFVMYPAQCIEWAAIFLGNHPTGGTTPVTAWIGTMPFQQITSGWKIWALTLMSLVCGAYYLHKQKSVEGNLSRVGDALLVSLIISPFGWFFDYAVMLPAIVLVCRDNFLVTQWILIATVTQWIATNYVTSYDQLAWFPLLAAFFYFQASTKQQELRT